MVNHKHLTKGDFWAPPGGGLEFGEFTHDALIREIQEETSIIVKPGEILFTCEFLRPPIHSIELFFEVYPEQGKPIIGTDPESTASNQLIQDVQYLDFNSIMSIPADERHGIFRLVKTIDDLKKLNGFYRI
jgi:8-oxo-dGTP diphosphatase